MGGRVWNVTSGRDTAIFRLDSCTESDNRGQNQTVKCWKVRTGWKALNILASLVWQSASPSIMTAPISFSQIRTLWQEVLKTELMSPPLLRFTPHCCWGTKTGSRETAKPLTSLPKQKRWWESNIVALSPRSSQRFPVPGGWGCPQDEILDSACVRLMIRSFFTPWKEKISHWHLR